MIGIVDYGLGNVQAFVNIYRGLGIEAAPVRNASELAAAKRLILPGVGAFDWAMERLEGSGMIEPLHRRVLGERVPVLGVCVGMQIMARRSEEGIRPGLEWIEADVRLLDSTPLSGRTQLPHMGWNDAEPVVESALFSGIDAPRYYFLHSYFLAPDQDDVVLARTTYGVSFASAVRKGNILATQFHPEKSHGWGARLLKNFAEL
ncbi:MAG: imidazole glycerol phosphate synthase subunit HisH [Rhodocyclaceae bacterium]|nr:imidazole glycerol phosphate synthase subunit HisH [Rhodocyclaceae bacterium]MCL4759254.1 imidazole glycerol phosphate synthase subunit HisH [Rhodocyclaceae bacterium]